MDKGEAAEWIKLGIGLGCVVVGTLWGIKTAVPELYEGLHD